MIKFAFFHICLAFLSIAAIDSHYYEEIHHLMLSLDSFQML